MGYFKDICDILLLKDNTYKRVGNDKDAFKRFTITYFLSNYLMLIFLGALFFTVISIMSFHAFSVLINSPFILLTVFILFPIVTYVLTIVGALVSHIIGLMFGGKPKKFTDFVKVLNYPIPIVMVLMMLTGFNQIISFIFGIWQYFILYKTYRIIHRLSSRKAGLAITVHIIIQIAIIFIFVVILSSLMLKNPALLKNL